MLVGKVTGEVCKRKSVLVERHPEENNDCEDKAEGHNAVFCLLRCQLRLSVAGHGSLGLAVVVSMLEGVPEAVVNSD